MNSIGLMGAAGSGKDTTARILINKLQEAGLETFEPYSFAGPLKDFTIDVFGIAPHIVEPRTPEDRITREAVVKITYSVEQLKSDFAWAISDILDVYAEANDMDHASMLASLGHGNINQTVDALFEAYRKILNNESYTPSWFTSILHRLLRNTEVVRYKTSPRRLLQVTGTEFFRENVSHSFWTDIAPKRNVIYTDVRFANELDFVHANGGLVLKIVNKNQQVIANSAHASEQLVYTATPDYTIEHDGVNLYTIDRAVEQFIATL